MDTTWRVRYVFRKLARSPLFSVVTVVTLALAIGANVAVFAVVDGVLLEPLPFEEPGRLVGIWHTAPGLGFELVNQSPALHFTYLEQNRTFESVGMWDDTSVSVTGLDEPEEVPAMMVTDTTLPLLGVRPVLGRVFTEEDDSPGSPETVILSHGYWQGRLGGDPDVLGRTLQLRGREHEVIGVLPAGLRFLDRDPALYLPFRFDRGELFVGNFSYQGVARLQSGASLEQANADVARMIPMAAERYPGGITMTMLEQARFDARVRPLRDDVVGDVGEVLWVLLGTVGMVLLIACANVANLFLVRADERQLEVAVRTAMGASRRALVADSLAESATLGLLGGLGGLGLAWAGLRWLVRLAPQGLPRLEEIGIDPTVLLFALGVSLLAGLALGLIPALRHGADLAEPLKEGGRGGSAGHARQRARSALVVAQMALALVLLVGSGLMIRSFVAMRAVDPGFDRPEEVLTVRIAIPSAEVEDPGEVAATHERIQRALAALPGVESVGASSSITMDGWDSNDPVEFEGFPIAEGQLPPIRRFKWITPGYFETMGNPVIAGRALSWADIHQRADVAMITRNLALEYWQRPDEALGRRLRLPALEAAGTGERPWREIVGVVGDVRDDGIDQDPVETVYWPILVNHFYTEDLRPQRSLKFAIRSARVGEPGFLDEIRAAIWSVHPDLPLANVETVQQIFDRSLARTSFALAMLAVAAGAAVILGAVGVYGVTSYVVSQRRQEIGVRMALGAQRSDVSRLVLRHGLILAGLGVAAGLAAAAGLTRLMSALLFGVEPLDPLTYGAVALAVTAIALLASYLPARRGSRLDPVEALRRD